MIVAFMQAHHVKEYRFVILTPVATPKRFDEWGDSSDTRMS